MVLCRWGEGDGMNRFFGYIDEDEVIHNAYEEGYADGKRDAVVHGHWVMDEDWNSCCSVCGDQWSGDLSPFKYCPHCGAKMDEVTE